MDDCEDPQRLERLIDQWLDDDLGPASIAELEAVLSVSPPARARFWRQAAFHSVLQDAMSLATPVATEPLDPRAPARWMTGGGLLLACLLLAIGGGLGSLVTSQALAGFGRGSMLRVTLLADGFEEGRAPATGSLPTEPEIWMGDKTTVVGGRNDVVPVEGRLMLEFLSTQASAAEVGSQYSSEIWRIVPVSAIRAAVPSSTADSRLTVELSAAFNQRGNGAATGGRDPEEPFNAGIGLYAFEGSPREARTLWRSKRSLAVASASLTEILDENPAEWQRLRISVSVPPATDFILLHCYTGDDKANCPATFDGQFIDDVRVHVTVDPSPPGGGS